MENKHCFYPLKMRTLLGKGREGMGSALPDGCRTGRSIPCRGDGIPAVGALPHWAKSVLVRKELN